MKNYGIFLLLVLCIHGVPGDELKSEFVTEGNSLTLQPDVKIQNDEMILWTFGPDDTVIVKNSVVKFTDRIQLNKTTGSITINNITTNFTGIYKIYDVGKSTYYKAFNVTVFARLSVPVIISDSTQCSSSCSVVCSVVNVHHVTLSWLKGNSVLSSISVSDLSISLSLPLEVEVRDKNNYICVVKNLIRHQSKQLDIRKLCRTCKGLSTDAIAGICIGVLSTVVLGVVAYCLRKKCLKTGGNNQLRQDIALKNGQVPPNRIEDDNPNNGHEERNPLIDSQVPLKKAENLHNAPAHQDVVDHPYNDMDLDQRDQLKNMKVMRGEDITLNSGVTQILMDDRLKWKYTDCRRSDCTIVFTPIAVYDKSSNEFSERDEQFRDRLQLDRQTGDLTIKNMSLKDSGQYKLQIERDKNPLSKIFNVTVRGKRISTLSTLSGGEDLNDTGLSLIAEEDPNDTTCTVLSEDSLAYVT